MRAFGIKLLLAFACIACAASGRVLISDAQSIKEPNVAGTFYPSDPAQLSSAVDSLLAQARPPQIKGHVFALINPHAGYEYSGQIAAQGYKLILNKGYRTVIIIAPSHYYGFEGVSIYPEGVFRTPLGDLAVDAAFTKQLLYQDPMITFDPAAFQKEHSLEVQLPFLQRTLANIKIVPIIMGQCDFALCLRLAALLKDAIGSRNDVLIVASTDLYHGYDYREAELIDTLSIAYLKKMDGRALYEGLRENKARMCGGLPAVTTILTARLLGHTALTVLGYTNSAEVTGKKTKGIWTVGYASSVIDAPAVTDDTAHKGEGSMLDKTQRKKLLELARNSIVTYLTTGKKLQVSESDEVLTKEMGAFVTLREHQELRGCIGSMVGHGPLYLTVRDMAVEASTGDPRFSKVKFNELDDIEIEISVLSPLSRVSSAQEIRVGVDGVLVRRGSASGVFLPQVATETGWSKEEFLSNLCAHKAGLPADAWKDKATELYVFTAEIFSEKNY